MPGPIKNGFNPRINAAPPARADHSAKPIDINVVNPSIALPAFSNPSIWISNNRKTLGGIKPRINSSWLATTVGSANNPHREIVAARPEKIANSP